MGVSASEAIDFKVSGAKVRVMNFFTRTRFFPGKGRFAERWRPGIQVERNPTRVNPDPDFARGPLLLFSGLTNAGESGHSERPTALA